MSQQFADAVTAMAVAMPLIASAAVWLSPEALRWLAMRLRMRISYIEAGRDAAAAERKRFEGVTEC